MAWDKKYINYGVAKFEDKRVKVYQDQFSFTSISVNESIKDVMWSGGELNVYLTNGKVRKYKDQFSYRVI